MSSSWVWFIICSRRACQFLPDQKTLDGCTLVEKYWRSAFRPFHRLKHISSISMAKGRATISVMVCRLPRPPSRISTTATTDISTPHMMACQRGELRLLSREAMLLST